MCYKQIALKNDIQIDALVTVHYFHYDKDFHFTGESHDFWEFLYVEDGEMDAYNGRTWLHLTKGSILFHKPNEYHNVRSDGVHDSKIIVCSFHCTSEAMRFFNDKQFCLCSTQAMLLTAIVRESRHAFITPLDNPFVTEMLVRENAFASLQMIRIYLEQLLLDLYRNHHPVTFVLEPDSYCSNGDSKDRSLIDEIIAYFEKNICRHLTIEEICHDNLVSYSKTKQLFKKFYNCSVMEYYTDMRIAYAKELIRSSSLNFSEIADLMGYNSIHYFSRQFRKITGMSPSEYSGANAS